AVLASWPLLLHSTSRLWILWLQQEKTASADTRTDAHEWHHSACLPWLFRGTFPREHLQSSQYGIAKKPVPNSRRRKRRARLGREYFLPNGHGGDAIPLHEEGAASRDDGLGHARRTFQDATFPLRR